MPLCLQADLDTATHLLVPRGQRAGAQRAVRMETVRVRTNVAHQKTSQCGNLFCLIGLKMVEPRRRLFGRFYNLWVLIAEDKLQCRI